MFPTTAFYHQYPYGGSSGLSNSSINKKEKSSGSHQRRFLRLDSLEGKCQTYPSENSKMAAKSATETVDAKMPPSPKESRWFSDYQLTDQPQNHWHPYCTQLQQQQQNHFSPSYWPLPNPALNYHYQVPYNLTKGQFEVMPMEVQASTMDLQVAYITQNNTQIANQACSNTLSKCVNSIFEWSSALANAVTTTFFTNSSLNPNAKAFTPLNPNAKEFHPAAAATAAKVDEPVPEQTIPTKQVETHQNTSEGTITPPIEEKVQMKKVAMRKCTPWISKSSVVIEESDHDGEDDDESDEDSEDDDDFTAIRPLRSLSVCSEDNFIQFEESPKSPKIDREKCSQFLKDFLAGTPDDSDDDDDESDEDWDTTVEAIFLDNEDLLEDYGLKSQWTVEQFMPKIKTGVDETDSKNEYPDLELDHEEIMKKVAEANEKWRLVEDEPTKQNDTKITFCEPLVTEVLTEDPELANELRAARISDFDQRQADVKRYNRLIGPILQQEHRDKIRSYIQSCLEPTSE